MIIYSAQLIVRMMGNLVRSIIAPPYCLHCKEWLSSYTTLCTSCLLMIRPIVSHEQVITATKSVTIFAVGAYQGILKQLICAKHARHMYAARALGYLLWNHSDISLQHFDYIVPIPLHWRRYAARGYNQTAEMAQEIAYYAGKPILHALKRIRNTAFQTSLTVAQRAQNVQDVFVACPKQKQHLKGAVILVIDDVCTTGATIEASVRTLYKEYPAKIIVAVAARVV